jgi:hypothetical protein
MDNFKIEFICNKRPVNDSLKGPYIPGQKYIGRSYNGLYEISPKWGSDLPTKVVTRKLFEEYFELVQAC